MLYNWLLSNCSALSSGGLSSNAISKSEDILISLVLECVWVHIDKASAISDSCINKLLLRDTGRINGS
jgi:hypothetical protein